MFELTLVKTFRVLLCLWRQLVIVASSVASLESRTLENHWVNPTAASNAAMAKAFKHIDDAAA